MTTKQLWLSGAFAVVVLGLGMLPAAMSLASQLRGSTILPNSDGISCASLRWGMEAKDNRLHIEFSPQQGNRGSIKTSRPTADGAAVMILAQGDCAYEVTVMQRRKRDSDGIVLPPGLPRPQ